MQRRSTSASFAEERGRAPGPGFGSRSARGSMARGSMARGSMARGSMARGLMALWLTSLAQCSFPDYSFEPGAGAGGASGAGGQAGEAGAVAGAAGTSSGAAGASGASGVSGAGGQGNGGGGAAGALPAPGVLIASAQQNVSFMVIEEKLLFWVVTGTEEKGFRDGKVLVCSTAGCSGAPTVIAEGQSKPEFLDVADDNYVFLLGELEEKFIYWTNSGTGEVMRCLKTGCGALGPTPLATGQGAPAGVRVSASELVDFQAQTGGGEPVVVWANAASGEVLSCPAGGCEGAPTVLASGRQRPRQFVSGNRFFYWLEEGGGGQKGKLFKFEKGVGKAPVEQSGELDTPTRFTLANNLLFAVDRGTAANQYADGKIVSSNPTTDQRGVFVEGQKNLSSIVADDSTDGYVYWNADGNLMYCRFGLTCQGGAQLLVAGVGQGELAYDGIDLFFTVGDEIRKVPKPPPPSFSAGAASK